MSKKRRSRHKPRRRSRPRPADAAAGPTPSAPPLQKEIGPEIFIHDGGSVFSRAPVMTASLEALPLGRRLERLDEIAADLGAYGDSHGALELSHPDLQLVRTLVQGMQNVEGKVLDFGLNETIGGHVMMPVQRMVRLYRFLCRQEETATIQRIAATVLSSLAQALTAATYFKQFDEKHMLG